MIVELIMLPLKILINGVIYLLPSGFNLPNWSTSSISLLSKGLKFFPSDVWIVTIGNIVFWLGLHFIWALIEWVYKKIPGVN